MEERIVFEEPFRVEVRALGGQGAGAACAGTGALAPGVGRPFSRRIARGEVRQRCDIFDCLHRWSSRTKM